MINVIFAFFISLIAPGIGQFFNGQFVKAGLIVCFFMFGKTVLLPLLIRILNFKSDLKTLKLIYIFNILYPIVMIIAAIDAAFVAGRINNNNAMWIVYSIILASIAVSIYRNLRSNFIISAMSGRGDITKYILGGKK